MSLLAFLLACGSTKTDDSGEETGITIASPVTVASEGMTGLTDAACDPKGNHIYFTADSGGGAGVFEADGAAGTLIADGFDSARNLVVNAQNNTVYVAGSRDGQDGIFAVAVDGSGVSSLAGTGAYSPQALDLVIEQQVDMLYFSGYDPGNHSAGIWRMQLPNGTVQPVPGAVPLTAPDGVAVGTEAIYIVGAGQNGGSLYRLAEGAASQMVEGLRLGTPAGIALTLDQSTLLISSLSADQHSEVVLVNLEDASTSTFNEGIAENTSSGGVHRAKDVDVFVWAGSGKTYRIDLQ